MTKFKPSPAAHKMMMQAASYLKEMEPYIPDDQKQNWAQACRDSAIQVYTLDIEGTGLLVAMQSLTEQLIPMAN